MRTADHLQKALRRFVHVAGDAEARLNELNVFPVADSDTGTNVLRTAEAIAQAVSGNTENGEQGEIELDDLAQRVGRAAMMSSRGNSGLILGQYLSGFSAVLVEDPWPEEWVSALSAGASKARSAVGAPVEGTILTVADAAAQAEGDSVPELLRDALKRADAAVVQTQFQLPVLTERGVVDAGGVALALFLRTLSNVVSNEPEFTIADRVIARPARRKGDVTSKPSTMVVGYELQFNCHLIGPRNESTAPAVETPAIAEQVAGTRELLGSLGTDVVVGSDGETLAAHVHAVDIGPIIEAVLHLQPFNIRVEVLLEAHRVGSERA